MAKRAKRDVVLKWLADRPKATAAEAGKEFGWAANTIHRWLLDEGLPTRATPSGRPHPHARAAGPAPAVDLTEADRSIALGAVRDIRLLVAGTVRAWRETGTVPDRDIAQALLNLQRTAKDIIETHPGLMKLAADPNADKAAERDLDAVMKALGLTKEET